MLRNLMNALVRSERVVTTVAKAKEIRPLADRLITLGKKDSLHARRRVFALLSDKESADKIFKTLAGRFVSRAGGYTRIVRTGYRAGDGAEMAILEYLPLEEKKAGARKTRKKKGSDKEKPAPEKGREPKGRGVKKPAAKRAPRKTEGETSSKKKTADQGKTRKGDKG